MKAYKMINVEESAEIVTAALNRPKLNLFNDQMIDEIIQACHSLRNNARARFVILTARGDHFSAGIDLAAIKESGITAEDARIKQLAGHEMMRCLENLEQVTVAALRGIVCGAGMAVA
ncbi:MAG: enoyl-CoA hydratase/isomerase family protein [Deltaproteobacteria bacterium]|nr:MAG: enoyl-CoA hydratase/isomerase family protein [Deltaproteobacteria bacterium]